MIKQCSSADFPKGGEMSDLRLITELSVELKAKERSREYHLSLLREDPFDWSIKLTVEALEAEVHELKKAVCVAEMELQQCG
jgi:hypothetical protein